MKLLGKSLDLAKRREFLKVWSCNSEEKGQPIQSFKARGRNNVKCRGKIVIDFHQASDKIRFKFAVCRMLYYTHTAM